MEFSYGKRRGRHLTPLAFGASLVLSLSTALSTLGTAQDCPTLTELMDQALDHQGVVGPRRLELIAEIKRNYLSTLTYLQKRHLDETIDPSAAAYLIKPGAPELRPCVAESGCLLFAGRPGEKDLAIVWERGLPRPEIRVSTQARTLALPEGISIDALNSEIDDLVQQWTVGHSLHPFILDAAKKAELDALGIDALKLRRAQREGIDAGIRNFEEGHRTFLFVSPTGTGKSKVLSSVIQHEVLSPRNAGKFHILVAPQIEIADGLAREMSSSGVMNVVRKLDASVLKPSTKPTLVVTTIQSIVQAVQKMTPEELTAFRSKLGLFSFDEAHHMGAKTWGKAIHQLTDSNPGAKLLGATATPMHFDAEILNLFENRSFWSYLDTAESAGSIERSVSQVVDQLDSAIRAGELSPLEHFYVINHRSFTRDESSIFKSMLNDEGQKILAIDPELYLPLSQRVAPLVDRHRAGFFACSSRTEAEALLPVFQKSMPHKKFVVFHAGLKKSERDAIVNRMRNGEDLFLLTVNLMDEGVDFPHLSLYVDLNRSLGSRQLLQRWGRVARLSPGKEQVEIATLSDWEDAQSIKDKIDLLSKFTKDDKPFRTPLGGRNGGGGGKPLEDDLLSMRSPLETEGITAIDDSIKRKELEKLMADLRRIFERSNRATPLQRLEDFVSKNSGRLPTKSEDESAYETYRRLSKSPETQWPIMTKELRGALLSYRDKDSSLQHLRRLEEYISSHPGQLPKQSQDSSAYLYYYTVAKTPESEWPPMSDALREAVRTYRNKSQVRPLIQRLEEFTSNNHGKLPSSVQDKSAYQYYRKLTKIAESDWPAMSDALRSAIRAFRDKTPADSPIQRLEIFIKNKHGILPTQTQDNYAYQYYRNLAKVAETDWPAMSDALRDAIRAYRNRDPALQHLRRLEEFININPGRLPIGPQYKTTYMYYYRLAKTPESEWPQMSDALREAIRKFRDKNRSLPPLLRLEEFVKDHLGQLPKKSADESAYETYRRIANTHESEWPQMSDELRNAIRAYRDNN